MNTQILLFDLGNVLVDVSHAAIARELARLSLRKPYDDPAVVQRYLFDPGTGLANLFDEGRVSPGGFYRLVKQEFGLDGAFGDFERIWTCSIRPRPSVEALLSFLHDQPVHTGLLSNTNVTHFQYVLRTFPWINRIDSFFLSYELKCRKPAKSLYERVLQELQSPAESVLYFDDILEYVEVARALGIHGIQVSSEASLVEEIRRALPELPWSQWAAI